MERRHLLATATTLGAAALAGCGESGPTRWLTTEPVTRELLTRAVGDYATRITDPEREAFVRRLLERGSVLVDRGDVAEDVRNVFDGSDHPFQYEDRVFTVGRDRLGTTTEWTYPLTVYYNLDEGRAEALYGEPPAPGEAVNVSALPAVDRRALDAAFPIDEANRTEMRTAGVTPGLGGARNESFGVEVRASYLDRELERSELDPQSGRGFRAVRYDGTVFPVHVGGAERREVELIRYRVRESWALGAYAERFADRYRVPLEALSETEREVLADAVDGSGYAVADDDGPAESLIETLREHESFPVRVLGRGAVASPTFRPPWRSETWVVRLEGDDRFVKLFEKTYD